MFCYTGQCQLQLEHSGYVSAGKFHPVTPHLVTTGTNNCIHVWDSRHPEVPIRTLTHKEELGQVSEHGESFFSFAWCPTYQDGGEEVEIWITTSVFPSFCLDNTLNHLTYSLRHPECPGFVWTVSWTTWPFDTRCGLHDGAPQKKKQMGCCLQSQGLGKPCLLCNGVEWSKDRTQAAESVKKQDHSRQRQQSGFIVQQQTIFSTPKILTCRHR